MAERTRIVRAQLDEHTEIAVEAVGSAEADVARRGPLSFGDVSGQIEALARVLAAPIARLEPTRASLEFGCSIGVESGKLTALLVKGSADASITITLEWAKGQ